MTTLVELYEGIKEKYEHGRDGFTDKHLPYHTYVSYYDSEFTKYRKAVKLLEIGVWRGGSMFLWTKYFDKYDLHGLDINDITLNGFVFKGLLEDDPNVKWHLGCSSTNEQYAGKFEDGYFDVIIDDGAHDVMTQFETFKIYFSKLTKNGSYYIEDVLNRESLEDLKQLVLGVDSTLKLDVYEGNIGRPDDLILKITRK